MILMNLNFPSIFLCTRNDLGYTDNFGAHDLRSRTKKINYIYIIVIENETITRSILIDDGRCVLPVVARSVEDDGAFLRIIFVERYIV